MHSTNQRISDAIADELFGAASAGRPVYTLADESALQRIADVANLSGDPLSAIVASVRETLSLDDGGVAPFRWQADAAIHQRQAPLDTPAVLPLLLVLTAAAEQMEADGDVASHNYYSRLHRLLKTPTDRWHRVEEDYRRRATDLWGALNSWLEAWEGERGIPTAYAVGSHEFVGLPMSQAVVRRHDRAGLHHVFALEGMIPGVRVAPSDMEPAMDRYASASPSPLSSTIRKLWSLPAARERIVEAACLELEAWDGTGQAPIGAVRAASESRLIAFLRTFPRRSVEFNLLLPYHSDPGDSVIFHQSESEVAVPAVPGPGGTTRLSSVESISAESLVAEILVGEVGPERRAVARRPRRVVPMRWDDIQGAFVEVERVSLADESLVIAQQEASRRVESYLEEHARPGWRLASDIPGLPAGWSIYDRVQITSTPTGQLHLDLLALAPSARTSLTIRGGFVLPGLLRKWSSLKPPEIVALAAGAQAVSISCYSGTRVDQGQLLFSVSADSELLVADLSTRQLVDGEYTIAMFVDGNTRPVATALLRLRSANTPQFNIEESDIRLVYSVAAHPLWTVAAGAANWQSYVNGARVVGSKPVVSSIPMPEFTPRTRRQASERPPAIRVGRPVSPDSCVVTGQHRIAYPKQVPGQLPASVLVGECETCGLVKRSAGTAWAARKRDESTQPARPVEIPPIVETSGPDLRVVFDALNHVAHGSNVVFERVAGQVEGSGLFADAYLRRQEVVGNIDVARDEWLHVTEWAVNAPTLVPVGKDQWALIGAVSTDLISRLQSILGGDFGIIDRLDVEMSRVELSGPTVDVAVHGSELSSIGVVVLEDSPAHAMASMLPPISHLAAGLKRIMVPSFRSAEFWVTASASWQPTTSIAAVGAYRLRDFRSTYCIRSTGDIEGGTIGIGNAQLVKHIANMWSSDPLIGYHSKSESVVAPLGADLPGLYGRALAICSGRAPRELVDQRMLQYPSVPRDVADAVFSRLIA